jgi:hypothetical protein
MIKKLIYAACGFLILTSAVSNGWSAGSPSWVGSTTQFNWKPRLGGVYWLDSRAVVKEAAPSLTQSPRPVLVDIKSDATGFGYRFDLNTWDSQSAIHSYYPWDGTDAGTPASPEDAMQIFGATGNAEFILNIPIPLHLTGTPTSNWGYDGYGYTWQTPEFYAAMVQYLFGAAGPQSEWQNLPATMDFFSQPASFNWADLRARRGHVNPYPVVAIIIGEEPYNIEGEPTGALYGPQAEKFRVAIRNRGFTGSLGLHVHDGGYMDDPTGGWFWPTMSSVTASDFSFLDLEHYYQFSSVSEDFKRAFPISINTNAAYWMPRSQWKSDYTKFLWIVQDTRNAIRDDNTVPGLGDPSRWQLGWSEHGIQIASQFEYNDMFSAMHWAGWLAESMRQNVAWDSGWTLLAEGFSHAQIQVRNGYVTRTPAFFVYQMAQEFYGLDYLTNSYVSPMGSTVDNIGNAVQYPWTVVRTFRDPANGNIHLFVVNQSTNSTATITGFENWNVTGWKQLSGASYSANNPLGVAGPEPIQTVSVALPALGTPLVIPPISVNHIILSSSGGSTNVTDTTSPVISIGTPTDGAIVAGSPVIASAIASDNVGVAGVQFKWDGANLGSEMVSSPFSIGFDSTTVANGAHTLTAVARDAAGNQTTAAPVTVLVSNLVSTLGLPVISVTAAVSTAVIGTTNYGAFTFTRTDDTTLPLTVNYSLGGTAVKWDDYRRPVEGDMPESITIPAGASAYTMNIAAIGNENNVNPETASLTLSTDPAYTVGSLNATSITIVSNVVATPPVVSLTSPAAGSTVSSSIVVSASASASSGVAGVQFQLDGANHGTEDTVSPYSMTLDTTTVVNGTHALTAVVRDTAGNQVTSTAVSVTVNNLLSSPAVSVAATVSTAVIGTTNYGTFTFTRNGDTASALTVNYTLGGTAIKWDDYRRPVEGDMPESIVIPAGASSYIMNVAAVGNENNVNPETASLTLSTDASYTVGAAGGATITLVSNVVTSLPTVTVTATDASASRVGPDPGTFTFTRSGSANSALTVTCSLAGTAGNGTDYNSLGTTLTIPAGAASATVTVVPKSSAGFVDSKTVVVALSASPAYTAGSAGPATVIIAGNTVPSSIGNAPGHNIKITWSSVVNKTYRVACKNNLSDATWTDLSGLITATGTTTSYTDTTASNKTQRYYVVYVTN